MFEALTILLIVGFGLNAQLIVQAAEGEETLFAELELGEFPEGPANLDTAGHYARPDVFELTVDTWARDGVAWT